MVAPTLRDWIHHLTNNRGKLLGAAALAAIIALGAFLRFCHLGQVGTHEYYAAAVKSMLGSWSNFLFVAFEPGGSVSLDKPPLGFWIEALAAYFLGVNGFALALPNAMAAVLSIVTLGGFLDRYDEVSLDEFSALVESAQLRYVSTAALERHQSIAQWVDRNCESVGNSTMAGSRTAAFCAASRMPGESNLYDCRQ